MGVTVLDAARSAPTRQYASPSVDPPTQYYGSPSPPQPDQPASSRAHEQGFADRRAWEWWFGGLAGAFKDGAEYWSGQRSTPHPGSCYGPSGENLGDWTAGCLAAKRILTPRTFAARRSRNTALAGTATADDPGSKNVSNRGACSPIGKSHRSGRLYTHLITSILAGLAAIRAADRPARTGGEPCPAALATARSQRINHHKRKITRVPREGTGAMGSLQWALSWLVVGAVGLAPILVYWVAGVIGRAFRRKSGRAPAGNPAEHREKGREQTGARRARRVNPDPPRAEIWRARC
jgi:hypothetical protein